ncbi:MAG: hypothetical protein WD228_11610 [Mycobacterium sp.]
MTHRLRAVLPALVGLAAASAALAGAGLVSAEPADPSAPVPTYPAVGDPAPVDPAPVDPAPVDPAPVDPAFVVPAVAASVPGGQAAPPPRDPFVPYVPEIKDQSYGAGASGGGVFGTLKDLWQQVQNPTLAPDETARPGGAQRPVSASVPPLPPGYVSINLPGSESPDAPADSGTPVSGPALPPGYYSLDGPPPPGYEYLTPAGSSPTTTTPQTPAAPGS